MSVFLRTTSILLFQVINSCFAEYKSYTGYKLYEVEGNVKNITELFSFINGFTEFPYHEILDSKGKILVAPDLNHFFSKSVARYGLKEKLIFDDYSRILEHQREENNRRKTLSFSWSAYYDVEDIHGYLKNMSKDYPEWTKLMVAGVSYEGRQLLGLRIKTNDKAKKIVFIESGIHAREWIAPATTTYFINQLLTSSDPAITSLRDKFEWQIFPTVNPDGYHYTHTTDRFWRKTRSKNPSQCYGADPNRNWNYNWGKLGASKDPCSDTFMGTKPFSEKETQTLSEYILSLSDIIAYIAFHSFASVILVPYSDSVDHVDNYDDLMKIGNTSLEYGAKVNGIKYDGVGTAPKMIGYVVSGGSMDWVRYKLDTQLTFTYELRNEGPPFHFPPEKIPEQGEEVTQMMVGLITEACNLGYC